MLFRSPAILPALYQPLRMRVADGRLAFAQFLKPLRPSLPFTQTISKDGVDEAAFPVEIVLACDVDHFIDRCVIGHSIEVKNLIQAKPQQCLREGLLPPAIGFLFDQPIERGKPADDAQHQFLAQAAIGSGELREGFAEERSSGNRFAGPCAQNANGDFPWFLPWHAATIATRILSREPFRGAESVSNDP